MNEVLVVIVGITISIATFLGMLYLMIWCTTEKDEDTDVKNSNNNV